MSFQPQIQIIYSHTGYSGEATNTAMLAAIDDLDFVNGSHLGQRYGDGPVDVQREQELVAADVIVLQFPFYWYSTHDTLKRWEY